MSTDHNIQKNKLFKILQIIFFYYFLLLIEILELVFPTVHERLRDFDFDGDLFFQPRRFFFVSETTDFCVAQWADNFEFCFVKKMPGPLCTNSFISLSIYYFKVTQLGLHFKTSVIIKQWL
jgi:hypothetical protein